MIKLANAPCSWGVLEFGLDGETAGFGQVLDEIRSTGYNGTELGDWGFMPTDPPTLHAALSGRSLDLVGAFVPVELRSQEAHGNGLEVALKTAVLMRDAGFPKAFIVLADDNGSDPIRTRNAGRVRPQMGLTDDEWKIAAAGADKIAHVVREECGLRTVFHHHAAGYVETPDEIAELMKRTNPDYLGLCLDTGHCQFGGGNPLSLYEAHKDRIWHVHFKDFDPGVAQVAAANDSDYFASVGAGVFCELGKGSVDFSALLSALQEDEYDGWVVVEQDVLPGMGNPETCALHNRAFLRSIGL